MEEATRSDPSCLIAMKHVCKFCHKRFPCGRSLGGHMRSHLIANPTKKNPATVTPPPAGAGDSSPIKCCKECGKGFHSSKALSGHMKSHAVEREKEKQRISLLRDDEDQIEKSPDQEVIDRESDNETDADEASNPRRPRRSSIRRQRSYSVSEIDQQEQEEVAMCLIMLSRDVGPWFLNNPKPQTGLIESSILLSNLGEIQTVLVQPDCVSAAMSEKRKPQFQTLELESEKRSKFECTTCNKSFHSYQALGGHRASHKKAKGDETAAEVSAPKKGAQLGQRHECPVCFKEFPSGQALGGHKRSHLMAAATKFVSTVAEKSNATTLTATTTTTTTTATTSSYEGRDFLDLNLPAPVEEEATNGPHHPHHHHQQQQQLGLVGFKPWWVDSTTHHNHKHEQLVGLI